MTFDYLHCLCGSGAIHAECSVIGELYEEPYCPPGVICGIDPNDFNPWMGCDDG